MDPPDVDEVNPSSSDWILNGGVLANATKDRHGKNCGGGTLPQHDGWTEPHVIK